MSRKQKSKTKTSSKPWGPTIISSGSLKTPKQMLPVIDRPMLEHVIAGLGRHGVDEVTLSLGYKEDVFREAYPDAYQTIDKIIREQRLGRRVR